MKVTVLSLKQPWAELVLSGKKTLELRSWNTKHRGEFYVHASQNTDKEKCKELGLNPDRLIKGAIIGKCTLVGVKKYENKEEFLKDAKKHYATNYEKPNYAFTLKNAQRIKPIPIKGRLGFWKTRI